MQLAIEAVRGKVMGHKLTRQLRDLEIGTVTQQRLIVTTIRVCVGRRGHERAVQVDVDLTEQRMQPVIHWSHGDRPSRDRPRWLASPSPARVASCWRDPGNRLPIQGSGILSVHPSPERPWVDVPLRGCRRCCSEWGVR